MKIFLSQTLAFVTLLFFSFNAKAQGSDYVINSNGDTLKCVISSQSLLSLYRQYQTPAMHKPKRMTEESIKEYYISRENALYRRIAYQSSFKPQERDTSFMLVLEEGKINLYENAYANFGGGGANIDWYVSKKSDTVKYIFKGWSDMTFEQKINDLSEMFIDNKPVYNEIITYDKLNLKKIRNIIHLYNTGEPFREAVKPKKKPDDTPNIPADFNPNSN